MPKDAFGETEGGIKKSSREKIVATVVEDSEEGSGVTAVMGSCMGGEQLGSVLGVKRKWGFNLLSSCLLKPDRAAKGQSQVQAQSSSELRRA